jgi:predicted O-methyltransferase YrrM
MGFLWEWRLARRRAKSRYTGHPWFADKTFTQDWTTYHLDTWHRLLEARSAEVAEILEIGSYEGRSAVFFLNFFPKARLTCVDVFSTEADAAPTTEDRFDANIAEFAGRVRKLKDRSVAALVRLGEAGETFDLIYIDGDHKRVAALMDSLLAWPLLKPGGIVIWDDYRWRTGGMRFRHRPKKAIDMFIRLHRSKLEILHSDYQLIACRKLSHKSPLPPPNKSSRDAS